MSNLNQAKRLEKVRELIKFNKIINKGFSYIEQERKLNIYIKETYPKCSMCGCVLFYNEEKYFDFGKKVVCVDCEYWNLQVKNKCSVCHSKFNNDRKNYKLRGNVCFYCGKY
jgi:hypothetical protein